MIASFMVIAFPNISGPMSFVGLRSHRQPASDYQVHCPVNGNVNDPAGAIHPAITIKPRFLLRGQGGGIGMAIVQLQIWFGKNESAVFDPERGQSPTLAHDSTDVAGRIGA